MRRLGESLMAKKKPEPIIEYYKDGQKSSLLDIIETDKGKWKRFLEENRLKPKDSKERFVTDIIGDYLTARQIYKYARINGKTLTKWRDNGSVKATRLKCTWYYSLASVVKAIKSAPINDIR